MSIHKLFIVPKNYEPEAVLDVFKKRFMKINTSTNLTPGAKNLMLQIVLELQEKNSCDCDWENLSISTGTDIPSVKKYIKELRERGFLIFVKRWRQPGLLRLGIEII